MSKYTQAQETEIVKDAVTLTTAIHIGEEELGKQKAKQFKPKPAAPVREVLEVPDVAVQMPPEPKADYSFLKYLKENVLYIVISCICWPFLIYAFFQYLKKRSELEEQLKQAPEYQKAVHDAEERTAAEQREAEEETARQQAELDEQYRTELEKYDTVVLPAYNKEFESWRITQKLIVSMLEDEVQLNKDTLDALYDSTKLISLTYRELWILRWLYDDMRTSDHDIRYATDLLDRDRQRLVTEEAGNKVRASIKEMHASMTAGFKAVYEAVSEGNEILAKTRRDQNLAATADIIQRHNLNNMVKRQNGMLDEYFRK